MVKVRPLIVNLSRKALDMDAFLDEVKEKGYSGEARASTSGGITHILFYEGLPTLAPEGVLEALDIMDAPEASVSFYILGEELLHALSSLFEGEKVWSQLSVNVIHPREMISKLKEKEETGHLCIYDRRGDRYFLFFHKGRPLGVYELGEWRAVDFPSIWKETKYLDYYRSEGRDALLSRSMKVPSRRDLMELISWWNGVMEGIVRKLGRKPVEISLQKAFGDQNIYTLDEAHLNTEKKTYTATYEALRLFKERSPGFLKEIEMVASAHWLNRYLQEAVKGREEMIERLSLKEVFARRRER